MELDSCGQLCSGTVSFANFRPECSNHTAEKEFGWHRQEDHPGWEPGRRRDKYADAELALREQCCNFNARIEANEKCRYRSEIRAGSAGRFHIDVLFDTSTLQKGYSPPSNPII
jgi:hypothetical protein